MMLGIDTSKSNKMMKNINHEHVIYPKRESLEVIKQPKMHAESVKTDCLGENINPKNSLKRRSDLAVHLK